MSWLLNTIRDCLQLFIITPILQIRLTILQVALSTQIEYNYIMDHLKELIKGAVEFQKETFDCSDMSDEDVFECVMENVVSMVEDYSFADYNREDK